MREREIDFPIRLKVKMGKRGTLRGDQLVVNMTTKIVPLCLSYFILAAKICWLGILSMVSDTGKQ